MDCSWSQHDIVASCFSFHDKKKKMKSCHQTIVLSRRTFDIPTTAPAPLLLRDGRRNVGILFHTYAHVQQADEEQMQQ
jgi:hypothetical protein